MPRRSEEETSVASAEAFRGAVVGAAKVQPPSIQPVHTYYEGLPNFGSTDAVLLLVGSHCWRSRLRRLLHLSYISRIDYTV